jgi:hypothetical protein
MTICVTNVGPVNLATLSTAERQSIEDWKADCLERWKQAQAHASQIYLGLKGNKGRVWAESQLKARPDIEAETRRQLNLLLKVKK